MKIQFNDVSYSFSDTLNLVLTSLYWRSEVPEVIGILGINGCGKSTFLRLLAGIFHPLSGTILVNDKQIKGINSVREFLCYIPENAKLFLIGPTLKADLHRIIRDTSQEITLLQSSGLNHLAERKIYELSEGQRRLAAIWLAFQMNRKIILLDEPTIGMDHQGKQIFKNLLRNATKEGKTVIIASNDSRILPLFDRITVIDDSKIILDDIKEKVLYRLEEETSLIPNQVVRLICLLRSSGIDIPPFTTMEEFNQYLQSLIRRHL